MTAIRLIGVPMDLGASRRGVDMRLMKRQRIVGRMTIDGMVEVFNLFNHENYGSYTTLESNAAYGRPSFNANVAYQPRIVQFGFRFAF
jgi:hypothetical protein